MQRSLLLHRVTRSLSRRPFVAGALFFVIAIAAAALASAIAGHPQPSIHDEFSYLLASDTFSHFRLANAPHPMWVFFESMHIVHQPSYASMYPPGQGMAMGIGQIITGDPIVGVWLSGAAMCAAIFWMLRGWLPGRWALVGGVLVMLKYVVLGRAAPTDVAGYWSQSYYGGAVAAVGGALLFGALGRILRNRPRVIHGVLLALGVGIVANSRPFEGFMVSLPAAIVLFAWFLKQRGPARGLAFKRVIIPAAVVMIGVISFMAYYNLRVTGKPTRMAWQHHHDQYCTFSIFIWQKPRPPGSVQWNHPVMADFHGIWEVDLWNRTRSVEGLLIETGRKLKTLWAFYIAPLPRVDNVIDMNAHEGPQPTGLDRYMREVLRGLSLFEMIAGFVLTLPLLALPWALRRRGVLLACVVCGIVVCGNLTTVATLPHYAAPAAAMFVLIYVQCLRVLADSRFAFARLACVGVLGLTALAFLGGFNPSWRAARQTWQFERARILAELEKTPEKDLVLVRYHPDHNIHDEWVFNEADIDAANVVWARDMGSSRNRKLLDYFKDRKIWLLYVKDDKPRQELVPYAIESN